MSSEAIREVRIRAGTVLLTKETPPSVAKIPHSKSFRGHLMNRVADALVGIVAGFGSGIGLDIVEGLGGLMERVNRRIDREYARYMEILERGYQLPDLE